MSEIVIVRCPVCGTFYESGGKCDCCFDEKKMISIAEDLKSVNADFRDFLRFFVWTYQSEIFEGTELEEIVNLARKILLNCNA